MSKSWLNYVTGWTSALIFMILLMIVKGDFLFNGSPLAGISKILGIGLCVLALIAGLFITFGVDD